MPETDQKRHDYILNSRKVVLKLGTRVLLNHYRDIDKRRIQKLVEDIVSFREKGYEFYIVTSGAVGFGMSILKLEKRPSAMERIQALASIGQVRLMQKWIERFGLYGVRVGQILLTYDIVENRQRFLYARDCLRALVDYGIVPIINENDSVAVDELKFGDNDMLSAITTSLVDADLLVLFTDTDGVYDQNPHLDGAAERISFIDQIDENLLKQIRDKQSDLSTGGMRSKLEAAKLSAQGGTGVIITNGLEPRLRQILEGEDVGTFVKPGKKYTKRRKSWIFFNQRIKGKIIVDDGAEQALINKLSSLLPGGVIKTEKLFKEGHIVGIYNQNNEMIGKGITHYSNSDIEKIKGRRTDEIEALLGPGCYEEIIHRDNMIVLKENV